MLDKGTLSLREREIVIDRTCARCSGEYEWGVHIALFAERVGFGPDEIRATMAEDSDAACWSDDERLLIQMVDQLHDTARIDDDLWAALVRRYSDEQLLEVMMLAGFYHMVSFVVNATRLPSEAYAARFSDYR